MEIKIEPLSVNKCWQGRRFKTPIYKKWRELATILIKQNTKKTVSETCSIYIDFYVKNYKMVDIDNFLKPFLDALVEARAIKDDRLIETVNAKKIAVKTKEEEKIVYRII